VAWGELIDLFTVCTHYNGYCCMHCIVLQRASTIANSAAQSTCSYCTHARNKLIGICFSSRALLLRRVCVCCGADTRAICNLYACAVQIRWVVASCPNYKPAPQQAPAADSANSRPLTLCSMAQGTTLTE
jgi:hypothetical protein